MDLQRWREPSPKPAARPDEPKDKRRGKPRRSRMPRRPAASCLRTLFCELRTRIPRELRAEPKDWIPLRQICRGLETDLGDQVVSCVAPLEACWNLFPETVQYLADCGVHVDFTSALSVLMVLDPPSTPEARLHVALHEALAKDHRLFLDRLAYCEACLEAEFRRSIAPEAGDIPSEWNPADVGGEPFTYSYLWMDSVTLRQFEVE